MYNHLEPIDDGLATRCVGLWAKEKLDYLRRYIEVFEGAMRDKWRERNYVDLMAGPGKNRVRETGEIMLGSPLLALTTRYPFTGYHFVDMDPMNTVALKQRCASSHLAQSVDCITGDCNVVVDQIVSNLRATENQSLNLAFLDPAGLELTWSTVAKLASIRRMDIIINYPEGGLNRYMRQANQAACNTVVDAFFGTREWRAIYDRRQTSQYRRVHRELLDLYRSKLADVGYVDIRQSEEPLMRNVVRRAPLYRLLFASKHELGERFWREVTQRNVYGQRRLLEI